MLRIDPSHEIVGVRLNGGAGLAFCSRRVLRLVAAQWKRGGTGPPPKVETMAVPWDCAGPFRTRAV